MVSYKIGFTGTQYGMSASQTNLFIQFCQAHAKLGGDLQFHHGQCINADEQAARIAKQFGFWIVSHPPLDRKKMSAFPADEVRPAKPFLVRNKVIVDESDMMVAAPLTDEEQLRSGTWSTIRYANNQGKILFQLPREVMAPIPVVTSWGSHSPRPTQDPLFEITMPH